MANPTCPHVVLLHVHATVHELLPTGEISGNIAHSHNERKGEMFRLDAGDKALAIRKLNETIDLLRKEGFKQNA